MKTDSKYMDKALDALIDEAAAELYEKEALAEIPKAEFSPEHEKRMKQLFRKERRKYNLRRATVVTSKVACVLLAVVLVMSVAIYSVEAWRTKFLNFVYDKDAPNTKIKFTETIQNSFSNEMVDIGYIPDGFKVAINRSGVNNVFMTFANEEMYFQLNVNTDDLQTAINTQKGTLENLKVSVYKGVYINSNNTNVIFWSDGTYTYRIAGNIEKEYLIKIAESTTAK